ncbi:MAG: Guanylate kinase [uncultured bacterium]|nr:MAG: Guanylate kinase [uncultured bacterium]
MSDLGNLYVIAAPSGTGKTTLVHTLVNSLDHITVSISYTTRSKRSNEIEGKNYYFIDKNEFEQRIAQHDFLEYATIFDNYYGTSKQWVEETLAKGTDVILEIDWQGHQQIKKLFPNAISIFILPPSLAALKDRLTSRNQDDPNVIKKRLADAKKTVSHIHEFDYIVINDDFQQACLDLKSIIESGRLAEKRQSIRFVKTINELTEN